MGNEIVCFISVISASYVGNRVCIYINKYIYKKMVRQTLIFLYLKVGSLCRTSSFLMPDIWFPYVRHQRSYVEMLVFSCRRMVILMLENGDSYVGTHSYVGHHYHKKNSRKRAAQDPMTLDLL